MIRQRLDALQGDFELWPQKLTKHPYMARESHVADRPETVGERRTTFLFLTQSPSSFTTVHVPPWNKTLMMTSNIESFLVLYCA